MKPLGLYNNELDATVDRLLIRQIRKMLPGTLAVDGRVYPVLSRTPGSFTLNWLGALAQSRIEGVTITLEGQW